MNRDSDSVNNNNKSKNITASSSKQRIWSVASTLEAYVERKNIGGGGIKEWRVKVSNLAMNRDSVKETLIKEEEEEQKEERWMLAMQFNESRQRQQQQQQQQQQ